MSRWRLVSEQNGNPPQVSTVVLGADEVADHLAAEAELHALAGWQVTCGENVVICRKGNTTRAVSAVEFDAMDDHPGGAK